MMLSATSCDHSTTNPYGLKFENVESTDSTTLTEDVGAPQCKVKIVMEKVVEPFQAATKINCAIAAAVFGQHTNDLQAAADSFCSERLSRYHSRLASIYANERSGSMITDWYNYSYHIKGEYSFGYKNCLCYKTCVKNYEGGINNVSRYICLNFNPQTGEVLTQEDFFKPGSTPQLLELLTEALQEHFGCPYRELPQKDILKYTSLFVPRQILALRKAMVFIYNPYEIAPVSYGAIELEIPYNKMEDILNIKTDL